MVKKRPRAYPAEFRLNVIELFLDKQEAPRVCRVHLVAREQSRMVDVSRSS